MIGYPLDSHVTYDSDGTPKYDRAITSEPLRRLYKSLFITGVLPNPSSNLQVYPGDGMSVNVRAGFAMVEGCMKLEDAETTLAIGASSDAYDRIDTVVMRLNDNDDVRSCELYVIAGTPATSPVRPELTRSGSIYEIGLADVYIAKGATEISAAKITDTRYDTARCGVISSISRFDTTTIYDQVLADLAEFKATSQEDFNDWFAEIRAVLSGDVAGNLLNLINEKIDKTAVLSTKDAYDANEAGGMLVDALLMKILLDAVYASIDEKVDSSNVLTKEEFNTGVSERGYLADASDVLAKFAAHKQAFDRSLSGLTFGKDEEGNWGYIPSGADAVIPFKNGASLAELTLVTTLTSENWTANPNNVVETMELVAGDYLIFVVRTNGSGNTRGTVSPGKMTVTGADSVIELGGNCAFYITVTETKTITITATGAGTNSDATGKMYAYVFQ